MSQDIPLTPVESISRPSISLGQWLTQARLASGLSVNDIAVRTNRTAVQVSELEADNYSSFSAHVVLRGMVRQYAKIVGADETVALQLIPEQFKPANNLEWIGVKDNKIPVSKKQASMNKPWISRVWLILLTLIMVGLLAYWIFGARLLKMRDNAAKISAPNSVQIATPAAPPAAEPAPAVPAADANATPTTTDATLNLKFTDKVWVHVRDAKGKVLLNGVQEGNTEQNLQGELPLTVSLGNGYRVNMTWKGQPYDLKPLMQGKKFDVRIKGLE